MVGACVEPLLQMAQLKCHALGSGSQAVELERRHFEAPNRDKIPCIPAGDARPRPERTPKRIGAARHAPLAAVQRVEWGQPGDHLRGWAASAASAAE